jgi:Predicted carbamoyl transferase, NodU family
VEHIAFSTTEFTKTIERLFPGMKENYYAFRRRKIRRPHFEDFRHNLKYTLTSVGVLPLCSAISKSVISRHLRKMGFERFRLYAVDHHSAHAASAAFTSGFEHALVITLDGLGDGLSGSISILDKGKLERQLSIPARDSLGIIYEQTTNALGMRELEDEGKIMAMADYSFPFDFEENKLKGLVKVKGTSVITSCNPRRQYSLIKDVAWQAPREQVAYMVQQLLENAVVKLTSNAIDRFGIGNVAFAGGVFSNVKANMRLRSLEALKKWYVFPHMGDGGLAVGAALWANNAIEGLDNFEFNAYLGDAYNTDETKHTLRADRSLELHEEEREQQARHAAELLAEGNYVFWFQDRMEYGPRALGHRSILAPSSDEDAKEKLNLYVKRREWFQPFASSMLEEDMDHLVDYDGKGFDQYMTNAYAVKNTATSNMISVVNIDKTTRPQVVRNDRSPYSMLLKSVKKHTGYGVVLNTSFNLHGFPIVRDPEDALRTMRETRTKYMFINGITVKNRRAA